MQVINDNQIFRNILINTFKEFIHVCELHNLKYFCIGGTLIGAIRHQGMIPWDDDIDVAMPRPDYDRLIAILKDRDQRFQISFPKVDNLYPVPYAKFVDSHTILVEGEEASSNTGVYVDIFPFDGGDISEDKMNQVRNSFIKNKILLTISSQSIKTNISQSVARILSRQIRSAFLELYAIVNRKNLRSIAIKNIDKILKTYDYNTSEVVGNYCGIYELKEFGPKEWFEKVIQVKFEDLEVNVPIGYHAFLTKVYGDYMQLPPEDQRMSHHNRVKLYIK